MTAQAADIIYVEDRAFPLLCNPLEALWSDVRPRPEFIMPSTACWRGYIATWAIAQNRLYLTGVDGWIQCGEQGELEREASLALLFPGAGERVLADWFSGELRVPEIGRRVKYIHMGYDSVYEREIHILIERGMVVASQVVETGEEYRRRVDAKRLRDERLLPGHPDADGRLRCPHCGGAFTIRDKKRWDGERHRCGGRVDLGGTVSD